VNVKPGAIVVWWDGEAPAVGRIAGEEKQRLRLVRARGKDERIKPQRVVAVVAGPRAVEDAQAQVAAVERRLRERSAEVEVAILWEIVREGDPREPVSLETLADLALGSTSGEDRAVLMLALAQDGLHFVRRAVGFLPREPEALAVLKDERVRLQQREQETRRFLSSLPAAVARGSFEVEGSEPERRYLEALEELAVTAEQAADGARRIALEALEASGIRWTRPHEGAFRLLRRLGRFESDDENLQVRRFGLHTEFPGRVLDHARESAARGFDRDGRRNLDDLETFSIDAPHTCEIDDLLSIESLGDGHRLGVHIADPAAFVVVDDLVDREALSRGLTHYMPDLHLPMLPPELGQIAASLVPGEQRPALSFLVDLDGAGAITGFEIVSSVVRSSRRLSYEEADALIAAGDPLFGRLAEMGRLRLAARARGGAVTLRAPEVDVWLDGAGHPVIERIPADSPSRLSVSEAMVLAGEIAARFCLEAGLPVGYRRQPPPAEIPRLPEDGLCDPVTARRVRRKLRRAEVGLEPGPHAGLGRPRGPPSDPRPPVRRGAVLRHGGHASHRLHDRACRVRRPACRIRGRRVLDAALPGTIPGRDASGHGARARAAPGGAARRDASRAAAAGSRGSRAGEPYPRRGGPRRTARRPARAPAGGLSRRGWLP
jgi:exoribonuclease-2